MQSYNQAAGSFESRVLVTARRMKDLNVTTAEELPPAEPIDTVPRVLKQIGLMGLPDGVDESDQVMTRSRARNLIESGHYQTPKSRTANPNI